MKINMANTYSKFYVHLVFSVKFRESLIHENWEQELYKYIAGVIKNKGHYPIVINRHLDHIHILFEYNLNDLISDLVREIKKASTKMINANQFGIHKFQWQSGYGAFSVGCHEKEKIKEYITKQKSHHQEITAQEEYTELLNQFSIPYLEKYVFKIQA